jgi:hypothetical protein
MAFLKEAGGWRAGPPARKLETYRATAFPVSTPLAGHPTRTCAMEPLVHAIPTLAVSLIYCLWFAYLRDRRRRVEQLRERVVYMLWAAADQDG